MNQRCHSSRRVVVTGLGIVCPVGNTVETAWASLLAGRHGMTPITAFDASAMSVRFAATVKDFDPATFLPAKDVKKMEPFIH
ncbi:MAG: beta-ketoacyl synthase N-terminal-like domain-containing protein [Halothiobacillaceae bacterium]|nr:beta-ketoacyl synthase N-terminal-like domain-containing protein [Halothiobacillaceae bacterium]